MAKSAQHVDFLFYLPPFFFSSFFFFFFFFLFKVATFDAGDCCEISVLPRLRASPGPPWRARVRGMRFFLFFCHAFNPSCHTGSGRMPSSLGRSQAAQTCSTACSIRFPKQTCRSLGAIVRRVFFFFFFFFFFLGLNCANSSQGENPAVGGATPGYRRPQYAAGPV
jgi:hypothetical protein